jgi:hypothetical protein
MQIKFISLYFHLYTKVLISNLETWIFVNKIAEINSYNQSFPETAGIFKDPGRNRHNREYAVISIENQRFIHHWVKKDPSN